MSRCCVCFNEIQELSNWEYQCQTCRDGIICYTCFHNVTNNRRLNLLRHSTSINDNKKILRCPCCRQINWKHLHNEIVNNMYLDIENKYKRGIATLAEHVFYRNWCSIEKDDDIYDDYRNDESDSDYDSDDDSDDDSEEGDITLKEIKIGDIRKIKTETKREKIIRVVVKEILQNEYIGTVLTFGSTYIFGDIVSFTKDDIVFTKDKYGY